jgi:GTPase involved in cell partitioning and DNA repair
LQLQQSPPTLTDDKIINEQNQHQHQRGSKKKPFSISLSIADLPGIVEGAANNVYGGLTCLRHLEYSEIILMIVDVHGFRLSPSEPLK